MEITRSAFVDESFRRGRDGHGYFFMDVVLVPDAAIAEMTRQLREHLPAGLRRWHWRDERPASRCRFLSLVADFVDLDVVAFTCGQLTAGQRKSEQARVRCLWDLLGQLQAVGADTLVLESRQEHNDRKDRREILSAQQAGVAPKGLVYRHDRPREDPLLWVPDALRCAKARGPVFRRGFPGLTSSRLPRPTDASSGTIGCLSTC